ncbi:hypothetical protein CERSUDRAFT_126489 [Gelatoporia subvermispora B]|uniref:Uncharacterized protein n=1 Tax=Ceriporiopsis subvermispora (strain B) TaxID=914234 RepID=M2PBP9_CERS8|nr:hypothetical protein CERSUDRAFT_126489 [Gelatoporia subvermispora B]
MSLPTSMSPTNSNNSTLHYSHGSSQSPDTDIEARLQAKLRGKYVRLCLSILKDIRESGRCGDESRWYELWNEVFTYYKISKSNDSTVISVGPQQNIFRDVMDKDIELPAESGGWSNHATADSKEILAALRASEDMSSVVASVESSEVAADGVVQHAVSATKHLNIQFEDGIADLSTEDSAEVARILAHSLDRSRGHPQEASAHGMLDDSVPSDIDAEEVSELLAALDRGNDSFLDESLHEASGTSTGFDFFENHSPFSLNRSGSISPPDFSDHVAQSTPPPTPTLQLRYDSPRGSWAERRQARLRTRAKTRKDFAQKGTVDGADEAYLKIVAQLMAANKKVKRLAEKLAKEKRIPDFLLYLTRYFGSRWTRTLMLIVENKALGDGASPLASIQRALGQLQLQTRFAFEENKALKGVSLLAIAGEYWTLREIRREQLKELPLHSLSGDSNDIIIPELDINEDDVHSVFKGDDFHPEFDEAWRVIMERSREL